jgi:hypothetical protein
MVVSLSHCAAGVVASWERQFHGPTDRFPITRAARARHRLLLLLLRKHEKKTKNSNGKREKKKKNMGLVYIWIVTHARSALFRRINYLLLFRATGIPARFSFFPSYQLDSKRARKERKGEIAI